MSDEQIPKIDDEEVREIVKQYLKEFLTVRVDVDSRGVGVSLYLDSDCIDRHYDTFVEKDYWKT